MFSPEEVWALVRAAASETDAALFLTAAFTGLRLGELFALCWRDVDFTGSVIRVRASYAAGALTSPKSGKVRAVPMAPDVASALGAARPAGALGRRRRPGVPRARPAATWTARRLRRRYKAALTAAGLRQLRFHDLRHTFGTRMIAKADIRRVQEWMGHADIQTTMRYLHYAPRAEDAALVAEAFRASRRLRPVPRCGGQTRDCPRRRRWTRMDGASCSMTCGWDAHPASSTAEMAAFIGGSARDVTSPDHRMPDPRPGRERYWRTGFGPSQWLFVVVDFDWRPSADRDRLRQPQGSTRVDAMNVAIGHLTFDHATYDEVGDVLYLQHR